METVVFEHKVLDMLTDMNNRLKFIEKYIDIETNIEEEVRPEYIKKLNEIRKEKGRVFTSMEDFDSHFDA
ncbi:hypothetical protein BEH94_02265 [Candidatus Altiarchaeales archaeon WOR_SM1_SCG]|nr:hypothetical protein BEH94_02265 [Candidatus Altiarchaeales archaeon WOR_SM1_SCG]